MFRPLVLTLGLILPTLAQGPQVSTPSGPRVSSPTMRGSKTAPNTPIQGSQHRSHVQPSYPWKLNITATVFWIGETPTANNPTPNNKSSWDASWEANYGGYDNPDPAARANYIPKAFIPKQNPFYIALPYNDCERGRHKANANRIPWFHRDFIKDGQSVCKGVWVKIVYNRKICFAQWEDCGPFTTEDFDYVFGNQPPSNASNKAAGIDISPAVRDYLGIKSGTAKVSWHFIDFKHVPAHGPWAKYGTNNPFLHPELDPIHRAQLAQREALQNKKKEAQEKSINPAKQSPEESKKAHEAKLRELMKDKKFRDQLQG